MIENAVIQMINKLANYDVLSSLLEENNICDLFKLVVFRLTVCFIIAHTTTIALVLERKIK